MRQDSTLTLSQAARELEVAATTLRRWTNRNLVPFLMTPGGRRRFTGEQVRQIRKQILGTSEAAAELGVSATTLRRWARRELVPYSVAPTGHLRFTWEDIESIQRQMQHRPDGPRQRRAA